ncbi:hypothetical protein E4U50_002173 [Claviceps purpurea]|nr:hypothetical protein E4U50_002173 [Claviceps purpurea]
MGDPAPASEVVQRCSLEKTCPFAAETTPPTTTKMGATGKSTESPLKVHWKSTGSPLEVHWKSTGSPLAIIILGVFDDLADCEADGGWVAGGIRLRTHRYIGFRGLGVGAAISVALGRLAVNL